MILPLIYENRGVTQYIDDIATTTKPHLDKARDTMSPYTKEAVIAYGKFLESASNNHDQPGVMIGWLEEKDGVNEGVNNEDIEDEDVEIELDDPI
ncbi:hypothetical protein Tco_0668904 [Tanacetum coccineum]